MTAPEARARELLAAEYERDGEHERAEWARSSASKNELHMGPAIRAILTALEAKSADREAGYCSNCQCDLCRQKQREASNRATLKRDAESRCWSCSCGWVGCYTRADIAKYGEPSECGKCYHENLEEREPALTPSALPVEAVQFLLWQYDRKGPLADCHEAWEQLRQALATPVASVEKG